jgi:hypothetical protein
MLKGTAFGQVGGGSRLSGFRPVMRMVFTKIIVYVLQVRCGAKAGVFLQQTQGGVFHQTLGSVPALVAICASCTSCSGVKCNSHGFSVRENQVLEKAWGHTGYF